MSSVLSLFSLSLFVVIHKSMSFKHSWMLAIVQARPMSSLHGKDTQTTEVLFHKFLIWNAVRLAIKRGRLYRRRLISPKAEEPHSDDCRQHAIHYCGREQDQFHNRETFVCRLQ